MSNTLAHFENLRMKLGDDKLAAILTIAESISDLEDKFNEINSNIETIIETLSEMKDTIAELEN